MMVPWPEMEMRRRQPFMRQRPVDPQRNVPVLQTEDSYVRSNMYRNEEISSIVSPRSPRSNGGLQRSELLGEVMRKCSLRLMNYDDMHFDAVLVILSDADEMFV